MSDKEITKNLGTYIRTRSVDLGVNGPIHIRTSQITFAPGAEWQKPDDWSYQGLIVVSVLSGEITFTHLKRSTATPNSELWFGKAQANLSYEFAYTHDLAPVSSPPQGEEWPDKTVKAGESVRFRNNFEHWIKNTGSLDATILVVAVINDDQCGGRPCWVYP